MRKTKIICTLGPATDEIEILRQMIISGMDVARLNFSHQDHATHKKRVEMIKQIREELNIPVGIMLDTRGPEIRLGVIKDGSALLVKGNKFILTTEELIGDDTRASVTYKNLPGDLKKGDRILIDDGLIELRTDSVEESEIICTVINGGVISNRKGVNTPGIKLSMPYMSSIDRNDILFAIENDFDFIASSFARTADDILEVRQELKNHDCHSIRIIAKIENADGVKNIDQIIRVADGIMVARGDMGVEIPFEEVPVLQKMLIKKAYTAGKQVVTATQMLDSMMKNPRPTRAEATDVANAIYDGTSAIMLSGETAAGLYPLEALKTMIRIAVRTENDIDYKKRFAKRDNAENQNVTNAISHATCTTAHDIEATAIITVTKSGQTARMISKYRPPYPIIGCTTDPKVQRQMSLSWGVIPILVEEKSNTDELFELCVQTAVDKNLLKSGDLVVITSGVPLKISGTTNLLKVHLVGNILVSGTGVGRSEVCGNLCVCSNEEEVISNFFDGDILVIPYTTNKILHILKRASGIITEIDGLNSHAAIVGMALEIPVIVNAENATNILKSGTTVTLDSSRGIVYCGDNCKK